MYLFLFIIHCVFGQEPVYKEPWLSIQVSNSSESSLLIAGVTHGDLESKQHAIHPATAAHFMVTDDKPIEVTTCTGTYSIYIHSFFCSEGNPINPCMVFQKIIDGTVSNKIGSVLVFRSYYRIKPFGQQLKLKLISDGTLALLSPISPLCPATALQKPALAFVPPFTS
jgi:hypothetical protein